MSDDKPSVKLNDGLSSDIVSLLSIL